MCLVVLFITFIIQRQLRALLSFSASRVIFQATTQAWQNPFIPPHHLF
jgi:hypothetical protein